MQSQQSFRQRTSFSLKPQRWDTVKKHTRLFNKILAILSASLCEFLSYLKMRVWKEGGESSIQIHFEPKRIKCYHSHKLFNKISAFFRFSLIRLFNKTLAKSLWILVLFKNESVGGRRRIIHSFYNANQITNLCQDMSLSINFALFLVLIIIINILTIRLLHNK